MKRKGLSPAIKPVSPAGRHRTPPFVAAAEQHRAREAGDGTRAARTALVLVVVPKLTGTEYAEVLRSLLALTREPFDEMARLACALEDAAMALYPRMKALARPAELGDMAMAIDADRYTFAVEIPGADGGKAEGLGLRAEGGGEHRTSNIEHRTSNEESAPHRGKSLFAVALLMTAGGLVA